MSTIDPSEAVLERHMPVLKRAEQRCRQKSDRGLHGPHYQRARPGGRRAVQPASLAKDYEMGVENDLSKVMISQQVSSLASSDAERQKQGLAPIRTS